jgi:hypothetical protein
MSRIKNPKEKKRLSLARDHRTFALEGNKSFRSAWRLKKGKSNRQFRRAGAVALVEAASINVDGASESLTGRPIRTQEIRRDLSVAIDCRQVQ